MPRALARGVAAAENGDAEHMHVLRFAQPAVSFGVENLGCVTSDCARVCGKAAAGIQNCPVDIEV